MHLKKHTLFVLLLVIHFYHAHMHATPTLVSYPDPPSTLQVGLGTRLLIPMQ